MFLRQLSFLAKQVEMGCASYFYQDKIMPIRIEIDKDRCKGCALCTTACPRQLLSLSDQDSDAEFPIAFIQNKENCAGCALCAISCPDIAIKVFNRTKNCYSLQRSRSFAVVEMKVASGK
jgi:2-oxoglutarate ferredoxin oxidoreductase subunit delta